MSPRIDPTLPLVWRSPTDLQLGATRARVILPDAGELEANLISALRHGVSRSTLITIGTGLGATVDEVTHLLALLEPAFLGEPANQEASVSPAADDTAPEPPKLVAVDADGLVQRRLAQGLEALGYEVTESTDARDAGDVALAVIAAPWVVPPGRYLPLLRRDVPHLAIVFDDTGARVGPLVEPGSGPCLRCLDLARRDADAAWPVVAAQLAGRPAASCTPRAALDASALAVAVVDDRLAHGSTGLAAASFTLAGPGALPRRRRHPAHPECGCRTPAGSATVPVRLAVRRRREASSTTAGAVPA